MKTTILILSSLLLLITARFARSQQVNILSVTDGDTCRVQFANGAPFTVRIADIDAPEIKQRDGTWAALTLQSLLEHRPVIIGIKGVDRYGRSVARVTANGTDVASYMVANGAAWHYYLFTTRGELAGIQAQAKAERRGLWGAASPVAPWDWRRIRSSISPALR